MRYPKASAVYGLGVGVLMMGMWTFFLSTGRVPEFDSRPWEIQLHITVEFITAAVLVVGGIATIGRLMWGAALLLFSFGMLTYTLMVSPGYYMQLGETAFVILFTVLLAATVVFTILTVRTVLSSAKR